MSNKGTRIKLSAALLAMTVTLSGCEYLSAVTFKEDALSGKTDKQYTSLFMLSEQNAIFDGPQPISFSEALDICKGASEESLLATFGAAAVGYAIDGAFKYGSKKLESLVDGLKKKSQKTYKAALIIPNPSSFAQTNQCLVFLRSDKKLTGGEDNLGDPNLALVLGLTGHGESAFRIKPLYLKANNAVAITAEGEPINISVAFAGKSALKEKGVNKISVFAEHTFKIDDVKLGKVRENLPQATGLIARHPDAAKQLELIISITENGSEVPDEDKAKAELKSLLDAVGPSIKDAGKQLIPSE